MQNDTKTQLYCPITEITRRVSSMSAARTIPQSISVMCMCGGYYGSCANGPFEDRSFGHLLRGGMAGYQLRNRSDVQMCPPMLLS